MDRKTFFDRVRVAPFGQSLSQAQVDGINVILDTWDRLGDGDPLKLAYILATAMHETGRTMQPVAEIGRGRGHDYGIPDQTGKAPYGRGYVQLTWRANYIKAAAKLGIPALASDYDKAMAPAIAAPVLVRGMMEGWFTGKKLADYISGGHANYVGARRIVNGTDRASLIAGYADQFEAAIEAAGKVAPTPAPPVAPVPPLATAPTTDPVHAPQPKPVAPAPASAAPSLPPLVQAVPAPPAGPTAPARANTSVVVVTAAVGLGGVLAAAHEWVAGVFHHIVSFFGG